MRSIFLVFVIFSQFWAVAQYKGTASVTQGKAVTNTANLYTCTGGRLAGVGSIKAGDNTEWVVPAVTNYTNPLFPFASDLHNVCIGANYTSASAAVAALSGQDIVTVDVDGEVITAYVFADNYFEMYINGIPVGKDKVPFTQFNSSIVRFKVKKPFTIAMLLVDWEENLGLGSELNGGFAYHPGDGGMVAVFKDAANKIIATTNKEWKAQTFYTSPVTDLSCPSESGTKRLTDKCSTQDSNNGLSYYGLHWKRPDNVMNPTFDDSSWPSANEYSNATIGVNNKPAFTNFSSIFDDPTADAQFIWSSNIILDNEVIVRYKVASSITSAFDVDTNLLIEIFPNPTKNVANIRLPNDINPNVIRDAAIYNTMGIKVKEWHHFTPEMDLQGIDKGMYIMRLRIGNQIIQKNFIIE